MCYKLNNNKNQHACNYKQLLYNAEAILSFLCGIHKNEKNELAVTMIM